MIDATASPRSIALSLAEEMGLPVFPCRPRDEMVNGEKKTAKSPLTAHGFEDASTNIECIETWFANTPDALVGVPTGAATKLFVVDVDPAGTEWYRENAQRLACSRIHKTSRGWHLLYRMPAVQLGNTASAIAKGVDTRGTGGYVIWWPAHGMEATGDLEDLTEPPAWLVEALRKPEAMPTKTSGNGGRAKYGEGERHKALLKFASSLRHKGVEGAPFEAALMAWNIENCDPPQDEADVRRIARDYQEKPEDAAIAQAIDEVHGIRFDSLSEVAATSAPAKVPLFKDLLFPGAWLLVGRPKIGKSWLLLQLMLAAAEGGSFLGFDCAATDAEALGIFGEDDVQRIQSRLCALGVARAPANTHVVNQQTLFTLARRYAPTFTFAQFLELWLDRHPKVRLVLIDTEATVRQVWESERGQEHNGSRVIETDYRQTRTFDELALRRQLVITLVNHASKRKGAEWVDPHELINRANTALAGASGSIALADPPDADPFDTKAKTRLLAVRGRDLKEDLLLAVHQREDMPYFVSDGAYAEVRQTQAEAQIMEALEEMMTETEPGKYVSTDDLASALGKHRGTVKRAVTRMLAKGRTTWKKSRVSVKRGKGGGVRLDPIDS